MGRNQNDEPGPQLDVVMTEIVALPGVRLIDMQPGSNWFTILFSSGLTAKIEVDALGFAVWYSTHPVGFMDAFCFWISKEELLKKCAENAVWMPSNASD